MENKIREKIIEIGEKFEEKFELESEGCSECGGFELIDKAEVRFPKGKYHCEYDLEKIKSFLNTALLELLAVVGEEVEGMRKEVGQHPILFVGEHGYNLALSDIKQVLEVGQEKV